MSRVVVVGGGLGGLAAAARLAKLGHAVTVLEAAPRLGGALRPVERDGFAWDAAESTLLPAALRDLFRKSGRPLERELGADLEPLDVVREHRFVDGTSVALPGGSRAAQAAAFDAMEPGAGAAWLAHVDGWGEVWEVLRRRYLETPWDRDDPPSELATLLRARGSLRRRLRHDLRDERLALVAGHPFVAEGHLLRDVPAWAGVRSYVEQRFGAWRVPASLGGTGRLAALLEARLATRGVTVHTGARVRDLVLRSGRVRAVSLDTHDGHAEVEADVVVCAIDPRKVPALAPSVKATMPAIPPVVVHVGLEGGDDESALPPEVVIHAEPLLVVRTGGRAPDGARAWTVQARGKMGGEDLLTTLARHDVDVRDRVVTRVDRSPLDQVEDWGGSPLGVCWQGRGTVFRRLGPTTPVPGVYAVGAHATPGAGLPWVCLSAALVADVVGPA